MRIKHYSVLQNLSHKVQKAADIKASFRCKSCEVLKYKYTFYMSKENLANSLNPQTILVFLSYILFVARGKKDTPHQN